MDANELTAFLSLLDESDVRVSLFDEGDKLRYANKAFRAQFGLTKDAFPTWKQMMRDAYARGLGTRAKTEDFESWLTAAHSRRGRARHKAFATDMQNGNWLWMDETVNDQGWMLCVAPNISSFVQQSDFHALAMDRDIALRTANTDHLTGALNRRALLNSLQNLLQQSPTQPVCLLLLDIDHFKTINDVHGHDVGDLVLRHFVDLCLSFTRRNDLFGRIGGEEFTFLLPESSVEAGLQVFERVRSSLAHFKLQFSGGHLQYTCSGGIACSIPGDNQNTLFKRADIALYRAKNAGRNRCDVFS